MKPLAFLRSDAFPGVLLLAAALAALMIDNSSFAALYDQLLTAKFTVGLDNANISKPILLWINDGLMALFFLYVGLEIKRELLGGHLQTWKQASLPLYAAVGGMLVPASIFAAVTLAQGGGVEALNGWAIPAATDIAFALGLLALVAARAPASAKIFLLALAIFDDLGAIMIIAFFYTAKLSIWALVISAASAALLFVLNRLGSKTFLVYGLVGLVLWVAMLKSGVHATLAGVIIAAAIPMKDRHGKKALLEDIEHDLKPWIAFLIMPVFAFANAGVSLSGISVSSLFQPITLGIILGLTVGKPVGIMGCVWLAERLGLSQRPPELTWIMVFGLSALAGIGFTMSLFIGGLAYELETSAAAVRIGVLTGSFISAVLGAVVLSLAVRQMPTKVEA